MNNKHDRASVSVIIPAYRWDNYLIEAIRSVLVQTSQSHEILLINDGAGNDISVPARQLFPTIKIVELTKNSGQGAATNHGANVAKGEWLALLDADDLWLPEKLAEQLSCLQQNPLWHACYTGITVFGAEGDRATYLDKPGLIEIKDILVHTHVLPSCLMVRRSDFLAVAGFPENRHMANGCDHDFLLRFVAAGYQIGFLDKVLMRFRRENHGNVSSRWRTTLKGKSILLYRNWRLFVRYGGWPSICIFSAHVCGECSGKANFWAGKILSGLAKFFFWLGELRFKSI